MRQVYYHCYTTVGRLPICFMSEYLKRKIDLSIYINAWPNIHSIFSNSSGLYSTENVFYSTWAGFTCLIRKVLFWRRLSKFESSKWKRINHKQSTRWQHLYRLKASGFFSLQKYVTWMKCITYTLDWLCHLVDDGALFQFKFFCCKLPSVELWVPRDLLSGALCNQC